MNSARLSCRRRSKPLFCIPWMISTAKFKQFKICRRKSRVRSGRCFIGPMAEVFIDDIPVVMMAMREALVRARIYSRCNCDRGATLPGRGQFSCALKMQARQTAYGSICEKVKHRPEHDNETFCS